MMKKSIIIILLLNVSLLGFSQQDTIKDNKNEHISVFNTISFVEGYYGKNYYTNTFGVDYSKKISNKIGFRAGASIFNYNGQKLEDKTPRRHKDVNLYAGLDYAINNNLMLSGTIFYNTIYSTLAANLNMEYKFNDNTFLDISFTYIKAIYPYEQPLYRPLLVR